MHKFVILIAYLILSLCAFGQSEDCSTEPSLIGHTLPINVLVNPQADDFDMAGLGCEPFDHASCDFQEGFDVVVCFTPSNDCEVVFQIATGDIRTATHVFAGSCEEPLGCIASANSGTMTGILLQTGVQYCFVAERCGDALTNFVIGAAGDSDCGIFRDPSNPFLFCSGALTSWGQEQPNSCSGLDTYSVLDLIAFIDGDCPCNFPTDRQD